MPRPSERDKQAKVLQPQDLITNALVDLTHQIVSLFTRLKVLESQTLVTTTFNTVLPRVSYFLLGYGTIGVSMPNSIADVSQLSSPTSCQQHYFFYCRSTMRQGQSTIFKRQRHVILAD
jgi:hypothetical protein